MMFRQISSVLFTCVASSGAADVPEVFVEALTQELAPDGCGSAVAIDPADSTVHFECENGVEQVGHPIIARACGSGTSSFSQGLLAAGDVDTLGTMIRNFPEISETLVAQGFSPAQLVPMPSDLTGPELPFEAFDAPTGFALSDFYTDEIVSITIDEDVPVFTGKPFEPSFHLTDDFPEHLVDAAYKIRADERVVAYCMDLIGVSSTTVQIDHEKSQTITDSSFPQTVLIYSHGSTLGSGVILHPRVILTAHHVVENREALRFAAALDTSMNTNRFRFLTGSDDSAIRLAGLDLVLLITEEPIAGIENQAMVAPVLHTDARDLTTNAEIWGAGYGNSSDNSLSSNVRAKGRLRIVECTSSICLDGHIQMEALDIRGVDHASRPCQGDSGSGTFIQTQIDGRDRIVLFAIVSRQANNSANNTECETNVSFVDLTHPDVQSKLRVGLMATGVLSEAEIEQVFVIPNSVRESIIRVGG